MNIFIIVDYWRVFLYRLQGLCQISTWSVQGWPTLLLKKQYECSTVYFRKDKVYVLDFETDVIFHFSAYQGNNMILFSSKNKQTPDVKDMDATPFFKISCKYRKNWQWWT